jgi:hypothetical protein
MDPQPPVAPLPPVQPPSQPHIPHDPTAPGDPYRFIMEAPPKKPKAIAKLPGSIGNNPFIMRLIFFIGGAIVLLVAVAIVINIFFGSKTNVEDLVSLAATQQEIVRVSSQGSYATGQSVKNAAISTKASITTQQQALTTYLSQHGRVVSPVELALKHSAATDKELTKARATSTFDLTFSQHMRSQLQSYAAEMKTAYNNATGKKEKALLAQDYKDVGLLLDQWPDKTADTVTP